MTSMFRSKSRSLHRPLMVVAAVGALVAAVPAAGAVSSGTQHTGYTTTTTASAFPDSTTTGVPTGVTLTKYTGPCTITNGSTVSIDAKDVAAKCGSLYASNGQFVITRSKLPRVLAKWPGAISASDSDINGGDQSTYSAAGTYNPTYPSTGYNLVLIRADVQGGKDSVECDGNCRVEDSYLHNQRSYNGAHIQGFLTSGGNHDLLRHNSIACNPPTSTQGQGCTGDVSLFGDNAQVNDVVIDHNRFIALPYPGYCLYGGYQPGKNFPKSTNVQITSNVFDRGPSSKCGAYGPVTSVNTSVTGNVWGNNTFSDGYILNADGTTAPPVSPSPTSSVSPSPTSTVSPSPTSTVSPSPTSTVSPSPTSTVSPSPTSTVSPSPTSTVSPSPTSTVSPSPSPTATQSGFPTTANTGVPSGVTLTAYTGPCTVSDGSTITIDAKDVASKCGSLEAYNGQFVITRSSLPRLLAKWPGTISASDSDINGGDQSTYSATGTDNPANQTTGFNLVLSRDDIQGGKDSVECGGNCQVSDSYLHNQRSYNGAHIQGFLTSGGSHMVLEHNAIACDPPTSTMGQGCSADLSIFGDLAQVNDVLVDNNRIVALPYPGYCMYGGYQPGKNFPDSTNVRITNNVFDRGPSNKCGQYGPVTSVNVSITGNVWSNNVYSDGAAVSAG